MEKKQNKRAQDGVIQDKEDEDTLCADVHGRLPCLIFVA